MNLQYSFPFKQMFTSVCLLLSSYADMCKAISFFGQHCSDGVLPWFLTMFYGTMYSILSISYIEQCLLISLYFAVTVLFQSRIGPGFKACGAEMVVCCVCVGHDDVLVLK